MKHRKDRTEREMRQAKERARERLEKDIDSILDSESFARYLQAMACFHTYSTHIMALILSPRPDATRVAGYRGWQRLGRQVRKGERGAVILVPLGGRITTIDEDGTEQTAMAAQFGTSHVWDISQMDGEPLPQPLVVRAIDAATEPGRKLYRMLGAWLEAQGVQVEVTDLRGAYGAYSPGDRKIAIDASIAASDRAAKTLAHEAAHHVAPHDGFTAPEDAESVGEGAAYVVTQHYNLETDGYSFAYIARWAQDRTVLLRNPEAIHRTASAIIEGLEATPTEDSAAT